MHEHEPKPKDQTHHLPADDEGDLIGAALTHLGAVLSGHGDSYWQTNSSRQETVLTEWAENLDILLNPEDYLPYLVRGGQEHDVIKDDVSQLIIKVTRSGSFGLEPGIELALVASDEDPRRFHLWEASPYSYLQRLYLHNQLIPGINTLVGIIVLPNQSGSREISIVSSQPRFDINPVNETEIATWFTSLGFSQINNTSYYREKDNLAVFDAHDKNVLRSTLDPSILIPFDVIPCHPAPKFLDFIQTAISENISLNTIRTTHTTDNNLPIPNS
jgi:hypothetical protein